MLERPVHPPVSIYEENFQEVKPSGFDAGGKMLHTQSSF